MRIGACTAVCNFHKAKIHADVHVPVHAVVHADIHVPSEGGTGEDRSDVTPLNFRTRL